MQMSTAVTPAASSPQADPAAESESLVVAGVWADATAVPVLQWAARAARARGATLEAIMAWNLPPMPRHMPKDFMRASTGLLDDLRDILSASVESSGIATGDDLKIVQQVVAAPAQDALAAAADRADLLVMGTRTNGVLSSVLSVSRHVSATAACPTVLVPEATPSLASGGGNRMLVGVDGSEASLAAVRWAQAECARRRLPLTVVMVSVEASTAERVRQMIAPGAADDPELRLIEVAGDPAPCLTEMAGGAEALVLGQHGRFAVTRQLPTLGSVSRRVAAHAACPVVIVPRAPKA
jgi:nucleotide-binding universal stress UspA family protein